MTLCEMEILLDGINRKLDPTEEKISKISKLKMREREQSLNDLQDNINTKRSYTHIIRVAESGGR